MKTKTLIKRLKLSDSSMQEITTAIQDAEKKTTGEIAVAVTAESAHYAYWELLAANILAAVVVMILLPLSDKILHFYKLFYWYNEPGWVLSAFITISCFASVAIGFYLANIPAIDRLIIPGSVKRKSVTHRAFRYFTESGIYDTAEHSGILIFVSYMERQVRIIADRGIAEKIHQDLWNLIADELAESLKKGNSKDAFINAIQKCGELLAENYPAKEENPNEFPDGLVILGDAEWY